MESKFDAILNGIFEPDSEFPLWCVIKLSCGEQEIREIMKLAYNMAIEDAAKNVQMLYHDGHTKQNHPTKHHQQGADNIQVDKQSILGLLIK